MIISFVLFAAAHALATQDQAIPGEPVHQETYTAFSRPVSWPVEIRDVVAEYLECLMPGGSMDLRGVTEYEQKGRADVARCETLLPDLQARALKLWPEQVEAHSGTSAVESIFARLADLHIEHGRNLDRRMSTYSNDD